jgi:hypothetical protein
MSWETKPGTGSLFRNRNKGGNQKAPNLKGEALIEINGQLYPVDIAARVKESEKAGRWLSLTIKLKEARWQRDKDDIDRAIFL